MIVPRIIAAACLLPTIAASSSTLRRSLDKKSDDSLDYPTPIVGEAAAAAIAEHQEFYEKLRISYKEEGCSQTWGEFPSKTSLTTPSKAAIETQLLEGGMVCSCGLLYSLAEEAILRPEEESVADDAVAAVMFEGGIEVDYLVEPKKPAVTKVDSWVMAATANSQTKCASNGKAAGYPCKNVDLIAHLPLSDFRVSRNGQQRSAPELASDVWGWTARDGSDREFVIWGVKEGHYFFEVTGFQPVLRGFMPGTNNEASWWHDAKVVRDHVFLGSESEGHGMQIFDMRNLLTDSPGCTNSYFCKELKPDVIYKGEKGFTVGNTHNVVANEESRWIYLVGGQNGCKGGLHIVDVWNPTNPTNSACLETKDTPYIHDAHCVNYKGPDSRYTDEEICFTFNGKAFKILDVSNKNNIKILASKTYNSLAYTHQGWLSSDHKYIVFGDEVDETKGQSRTRTLIYNVEDLHNPRGNSGNPDQVIEFKGRTAATDHNQYVVEATQNYGSEYQGVDLIFQANYKAGLQILQVIDYETGNFQEVGYFDTYPLNNDKEMSGAWSSFPYFKSGLVAISSTKEGLFLVKPDLEGSMIVPPAPPTPHPTPSPTFQPTLSPTQKPTKSKDCTDRIIQYEDNPDQNCDWVQDTTKKKTRKKCKLKWKGKKIHKYCRETCGKAGLGICKKQFKNKVAAVAAAATKVDQNIFERGS